MSGREVLQKFVLYFREPLKLLYTVLCTAAGFYIALGLRFDFDEHQILTIQRLELPLSLLLFFRIFSYSHWNLNEGYWRHVSTKELKDIFKAHTLSSLAFSAAILFLGVREFPRSVLVIEYILSILFAGGSRFITRIFCEEFLSDAPRSITGGKKDIVILGGGNSGHLLVKTLLAQRKLGFRPLLILDDDERMRSASVHGVPVQGKTAALAQILAANPTIYSVIVAIPSVSRTKLSEYETICKSFNVALKKLQSFEDVALTDSLNKDGEISIENLLDRHVTIQHEELVRQQIKGKTVLVTGAGGSIGSELVRQILPYGPGRLILLDASEFNLYRLELEIGKIFLEVSKRFAMANICDAPRLGRIFSEEKPDIVFHAAAYKHVPMMESNCSQAFQVNVIGTWNLLEASSRNRVDRFVFISTDKAIDPSSVMGCSKRMAEWIVNQFSNGLGSRTNPDGKPLSTAIVRFGNVINSNGSVIPLFREQILGGGPVTVTHPEIERYFMAIQEAVRLVLTAGTLSNQGDVFVLDMGKRIKIADIARKMLALYGRTDIKIHFTGLRPGEKLTEELLCSFERTTPTNFEKVERVIAPPLAFDIAREIKELEAVLHHLSDQEVGSRMHAIVQRARKALQNVVDLEHAANQ